MHTAPAETATDPAAPAAPSPSPADDRGAWYVVNTYSGHEDKVLRTLETRVETLGVSEDIYEIVVPTRTVTEVRSGARREVEKKTFPGYVLVRMQMTDRAWGVVVDTPGVSGFVGSDMRSPAPLTRTEVARFLGSPETQAEARTAASPEFAPGDKVKVVAGAFADFDAVISDTRPDADRVLVLVNIFGRDTEVELSSGDIIAT